MRRRIKPVTKVAALAVIVAGERWLRSKTGRAAVRRLP
jgi:hypothetical protein